MALDRHSKGGNCPKSKSDNWQPRKEIKVWSSKVSRINNKKEINKQLGEQE